MFYPADTNSAPLDDHLRLNDVTAAAVLGCETCSETVAIVDANEWAQEVLGHLVASKVKI